MAAKRRLVCDVCVTKAVRLSQFEPTEMNQAALQAQRIDSLMARLTRLWCKSRVQDWNIISVNVEIIFPVPCSKPCGYEGIGIMGRIKFGYDALLPVSSRTYDGNRVVGDESCRHIGESGVTITK